MKKQKYLIAIGYPIGIIGDRNDLKFTIELKDKVFRIGSLELLVWQLALEIRYLNEIEKAFVDITNKSREEFLNIKEDLIKAGLIKEISEYDMKKTYEYIKDITFQKQGFGIGMQDDLGVTGYYIDIKEKINVGLITYLIWCQGDGKTTIETIICGLIKKMDLTLANEVYNIVKAILFLYENKLIYFKG